MFSGKAQPMLPPGFERLSRIIAVTGHYGSGKTNVAVNLAFAIRAAGYPVTIADLDVVNPYFRTADAKAELEAAGIRTMIPYFANTNVDIPMIGGELMSIFTRPDEYAVIDVGGDNGAVALGVLREGFKSSGYDMLCVVSKYRPLTSAPEDAAAGARDIEALSGLHITGIVNNSNIGRLTDAAVVKDTAGYAQRTADMLGVPMLFTSVICPGDFGDMPVFRMNSATKELF